MSVTFDTMRGFALGNHVWFCEEGTHIIDGTEHIVSASYIPPATYGGWKQIGAVSSVQLEQNIETATAQGPNPFVLQDIDEMVTDDPAYASVVKIVTVDVVEAFLILRVTGTVQPDPGHDTYRPFS